MRPLLHILPAPQSAVWRELEPFTAMGFVLYGGTALALRLGHRESIDFDFFNGRPLDKRRIADTTVFKDAQLVQDAPDALTFIANRSGATVKISCFGDLVPARIAGRVGEPEMTDDGVLMIASVDDIFATKVKVILDRAEAKDYRDITAMLRTGASLDRALGSAVTIYGRSYQPADSIKAITYFDDGDLPTLDRSERALLRRAAAAIRDLPIIPLASVSLAAV